jgi:hypothetical protein
MPPNLWYRAPPYNPYVNPRPLHPPEERPSQYAPGFYPHPPNPPIMPYHAMSNYHTNRQMNRPSFHPQNFNSGSFMDQLIRIMRQAISMWWGMEVCLLEKIFSSHVNSTIFWMYCTQANLHPVQETVSPVQETVKQKLAYGPGGFRPLIEPLVMNSRFAHALRNELMLCSRSSRWTHALLPLLVPVHALTLSTLCLLAPPPRYSRSLLLACVSLALALARKCFFLTKYSRSLSFPLRSLASPSKTLPLPPAYSRSLPLARATSKTLTLPPSSLAFPSRFTKALEGRPGSSSISV